MYRTRRVSNRKRTRRKRQRAGVATFKIPTHRTTGTSSALALRNALLKKNKHLASKRRSTKSFSAEEVLAAHSRREQTRKSRAQEHRAKNRAMLSKSDFDIQLKAHDALNESRRAMKTVRQYQRRGLQAPAWAAKALKSSSA